MRDDRSSNGVARAGRFGSRALLFAGVLGPVLVVACGTPPPPVVPIAAPSAPVPTASAPEPDLSPVDEPKSLVAVARWASPQQTVTSVQTMFHLPVDLVALVKEEIHDPDLAGLFQLDAPVDAVAALDPASKEMSPEFFGAVSIPLTSFEQAKAFADKEGHTSELRPGVVLIKKRKDAVCAIARAVGKAPARLVCGPRERDLEALLPWLTRGAPNQAVGKSDLHLELRLAPAQAKYQGMLTGNAGQLGSLASMMVSRQLGTNDPAVLDTVSDLVGECVAFIDDLDGITMDGTLDATGTIDWTGTAKYRHANSWFVRVSTNRADQAGPPPAIFFQTPKDSDSAQYGRGADPKLFAGITKRLGDLANAGLQKTPLAEADRKAIVQVLANTPLPAATQVAAQGHVERPAASKLKPGSSVKGSDLINDAKAKFAATVGWTLVGVDEPNAAYTSWLKELVTVWNRPGIQTALKKLVADDSPAHHPKKGAPPEPKVGKMPMHEDPTKLIPHIRIGSIAGLPAGSVVVEGTVDIDSATMNGEAAHVTVAGPAAKGQLTMRVVVMPDGANRTWMAIGADADPLKTHLLAVKDGAPKEGTMATRDGIDAIKSSSAIGAGFFTLDGIVARQVRSGALGAVLGASPRHHGDHDAPDPEKIIAALDRLPNKGATPMFVVTTGKAGDTPSTTVDVKITKGTIDDLGSLVLAFAPTPKP